MPVEKKSDRDTEIADYVLDHPDGDDWAAWLKDKRVELNAMTTEALIDWLDRKMEEHGARKVIPPASVMAERASGCLAQHIRQDLTDQILREARIDEQVTAAITTIPIPSGKDLVEEAEMWLNENSDKHWTSYVDGITRDLADRCA
jgi:hypothetical protein